MEKEQNIIFELLKNEHFVRWVQKPTDESNHYWTKWISNHDEHARGVEVARRMIQSGHLKHAKPIPEVRYDAMLENIMIYAQNNGNYSSASHTSYWRYIAVAASIVLVIVSGILLLDFGHIENPIAYKVITKEAPYGNKLTTRLPDGTTVMLNSGSSISFPEKFSDHERRVQLIGEAFFEVEHNPSKPFFVEFQDQEVKVLGTSFNIRSYSEEEFTSVAVATGKVSFSQQSGNEIILRPDEKASLTNGSAVFKKDAVDRLSDFGWRDRILLFDSNNFAEITAQLERWYGVSVEIKGTYPSGTYSGKFDNSSLKEVLTGLSFVYRFDYTIEDSVVIITKQHN